MRAIPKVVSALLLAGTASCVAYAQGGYQEPPGAPPQMNPQPGYQNPSPGGYPGYPDDRYGNQGSPAGEVGFFYQELSPYGDWIFTYEYGWTWLPRDVGFGWRPYTYGQWVPSDYGWFWASYEPFGWATYHFGRWAFHPRLGWIWIPGRTWGPAWVSWQSGNGYIGWAPLPPEVGFDVSVGLQLGGFDLRIGINADAYTFVDERNFLERDPYRYAQPAAQNVTIIQNTTNITNYTVVNNQVVNRGVDVERIERSTGRRVQRMHVREVEAETDKREQVRGDEVVAYRPSKVHLDSVRVDENRPRRGRGEGQPPASAQQEPSTRGGQPTPPTRSELEVAPRVRPEAPVREERVQHEEQQERQKLDAYERSERQRLEKVHDAERAKPKTQAEAAATAQRQAEEKRALEENLKRTEQQLQGRQEVERKAEQATPPPGKQTAAEKKDKEKGKKKKPPTDEPPPPPFR